MAMQSGQVQGSLTKGCEWNSIKNASIPLDQRGQGAYTPIPWGFIEFCNHFLFSSKPSIHTENEETPTRGTSSRKFFSHQSDFMDFVEGWDKEKGKNKMTKMGRWK
jgi:hypothetical protein